jgi:hypothetical protein
MRWTTALPARRLTTRPERRRTEACWLAEATEMPRMRASWIGLKAYAA